MGRRIADVAGTAVAVGGTCDAFPNPRTNISPVAAQFDPFSGILADLAFFAVARGFVQRDVALCDEYALVVFARIRQAVLAGRAI